MPFNGTGTYAPPPAAPYPAVGGTTILASQFNAVINDVAAALSDCITRDGQSPPTANLPMAGFTLTGLGGINPGAGTVGAPSLTFSDVTTGLYRPALNQVGVSIAGAQVGLFLSSGLTVTGAGIFNSVVTPTIQAGAATALTLNANSINYWQVLTTGTFVPQNDNTTGIGSVTNRVSKLYTLLIDSGASGAPGTLSLQTNNGTTGLQIVDTASGVRNVTIASAAAGGNPTISTTAGGLAITPDVFMAGNLAIGATPASLGTLRIPYGTSVFLARNSNNTGNINLLDTNTINAVPNVVRLGDSGSTAGVQWLPALRSGLPTTSDIPGGFCGMWKDTSGGSIKLYYNDSGTLKSVTLT